MTGRVQERARHVLRPRRDRLREAWSSPAPALCEPNEGKYRREERDDISTESDRVLDVIDADRVTVAEYRAILDPIPVAVTTAKSDSERAREGGLNDAAVWRRVRRCLR